MDDKDAALSDREMLAVILNAGIRGKNIGILATELEELLGTEKDIPAFQVLAEIEGLGTAKACTVTDMLEYGRRPSEPSSKEDCVFENCEFYNEDVDGHCNGGYCGGPAQEFCKWYKYLKRDRGIRGK